MVIYLDLVGKVGIRGAGGTPFQLNSGEFSWVRVFDCGELSVGAAGSGGVTVTTHGCTFAGYSGHCLCPLLSVTHTAQYQAPAVNRAG